MSHAGAGIAAPADCPALRTAYREALEASQVCDAKAAKPCEAQRASALEDACHCPVSVNPGKTGPLDRLIAQYRDGGCEAKPAFCNRACPAPLEACGATPQGQAACGRH
jgi:hypothetical protein